MKITIENLEVSSEYNAKIFLKKEQDRQIAENYTIQSKNG